MSEGSYRTILRSSSIVAGAQIVNVLVNIVKIKIIASLLGPFGVGLAGLYGSILQTGSTIAGLGFNIVGTRQVAAAHAEDDERAVRRVRTALLWGTMALAVAGAAGVWIGRVPIAAFVFDDPARSDEVAWLAIGVALTVAASSQSALLNGLRRLGDLARLQISASVLAAIFGVVAVWIWGTPGVLVMVLTVPAVSFLVGHFFVSRLPKTGGEDANLAQVSEELRMMAKMGLAVMLSALVGVGGQLLVRVIVQQDLGSDALGYFQAAFAISMTYLGFILNAMGTDYFPRLSGVINTPQTAVRLVNEQTEVGLLLCGPMLIAILGLSPWLIELLYSRAFIPSVDILRWQLLGDLLKVMGWPLGFVLLAQGASKTFTFTETLCVGVLVLGTWIGVDVVGLEATGIAFLAMYAVYLPLMYWLCRRRIGMRWSRAVMVQAAVVFSSALAVDLIATWSALMGAVAGVLCAGILGIWAIIRFSEMAELGGKMAVLAGISGKLRTWLLKRI